jgi:hypothetical protein
MAMMRQKTHVLCELCGHMNGQLANTIHWITLMMAVILTPRRRRKLDCRQFWNSTTKHAATSKTS